MWEDTNVSEGRAASIFGTKVSVALPSETLISYHITTRCNNQEDHDLSPYLRENTKTRNIKRPKYHIHMLRLVFTNETLETESLLHNYSTDNGITAASSVEEMWLPKFRSS
jgi:hypothetical protein